MKNRSFSVQAVLLSFALLAMTMPVRAGFISDGSGNLWEHDITSNTSTLIGKGAAWWDIAQDPTTSLLYGITASGSLGLIDTNTAAYTIIGGGVSGLQVSGLTFDSTGTLFASAYDSLLTVDLTTGASTLVGVNGTGIRSDGDIAFDASGNLFMAATGGRIMSLDPMTGAGTLIGSTGFSKVVGLDYYDSTLIGFTIHGLTLEIDTATGTGTQIAVNDIRTYGADGASGPREEIRLATVPEPATIALLGLSLTGLGFARRRKR